MHKRGTLHLAARSPKRLAVELRLAGRNRIVDNVVVGPIEVKGKPGTIGRLDEGVLLVWFLGGVVLVAAIYLATDSDVIAYIALLALAMTWRPMQRRAAEKRPLPPYPDPPPSFHPLAWQRWGWLPGCALLGAGLGAFTNLVGGGFLLWVWLGAVGPLCFLQNRYGVQQQPRAPGRLRRLLRRPTTDASG